MSDNSYLGNFQASLANLLTLLTLYLVRNICPNYQGMLVNHPPYVITCLKTFPANILEKRFRHDAHVILLPISEICKIQIIELQSGLYIERFVSADSYIPHIRYKRSSNIV